MGIIDISPYNLALAFLLLIVSIAISYYYKLKLLRRIFISISRMTVQLLFIGIYLEYLFVLDSSLANILWIFIMILIASYTTIKNTPLSYRKMFSTVFLAFTLSVLSMLLFLNYFIIQSTKIFSVQYLIPLGGMLLGNSMNSVIIALNMFFSSLKKDLDIYYNMLAYGANQHTALLPYLQEAMYMSFKPTLATMATMGLVSLPGMMTGTILGGVTPTTAIKYQIMIMLGIFTCINISVFLVLFIEKKSGFTGYGTLKENILKQ